MVCRFIKFIFVLCFVLKCIVNLFFLKYYFVYYFQCSNNRRIKIRYTWPLQYLVPAYYRCGTSALNHNFYLQFLGYSQFIQQVNTIRLYITRHRVWGVYSVPFPCQVINNNSNLLVAKVEDAQGCRN